MVRTLALVEGPTERNFSQRILAPHLGRLGIAFHPRVIGSPGHKGGVGPWDRAKREICNLIRQEPDSVFTTMFDLYALPNNWPGRKEATENGLKYVDAVAFIEAKISDAIQSEFANSGPQIRFIPYLSQHEFEALLFSNIAIFAQVVQQADCLQSLQAILEECGECEKIDDTPEGAPSKRILKIAPRYSKTVDGIAAAERIGLPALRAKCPHFNSWVTRLEQFGTAGGGALMPGGGLS
jgi:hypothetical protein